MFLAINLPECACMGDEILWSGMDCVCTLNLINKTTEFSFVRDRNDSFRFKLSCIQIAKFSGFCGFEL